jgi:predicted dehydrogenase/nucleoside-diphosphate-sugar epimerase
MKVDSSSNGASAKRLRVIVAGAGKMGAHHARVVTSLGDMASLVGIVDPSEAARQELLDQFPGVAGFDDLESAHQSVHGDVVHVCTPPALHQEVANAALTLGCHTYVEKPFTPTTSGAEQVLQLADEKGLKVCAGHQLLYERPALEAADLANALGSLTHVESYFSFRPVRQASGHASLMRPDLQLLDILPHPTYTLLRFLTDAVPDAATQLKALEAGPGGTIHALIRRGSLTGSLFVTLDGRPIESYLRLVGTNGSLHADFVRGTVQRLIGPGVSGIDKLLAPYLLSWQLFGRSTRAFARRFIQRKGGYPGLTELISAFYDSIDNGGPSPTSPDQILETVRICEQVGRELDPPNRTITVTAPKPDALKVVVTGGTGFLGKEVVHSLLRSGAWVRVVAHRLPAPWQRIPDVEYVASDLASSCGPNVLHGVDVVIHCAAATSGGFDQHQRDSIDATENLLRSAADHGITRLIHVSSLAVLQNTGRRPMRSDGPTEPKSRQRGPYVWGKLESEKRAEEMAQELGLDIRIVRPAALVDYREFDPPGLLGRRIGNVFVAVGATREHAAIADVSFAAEAITWMAYSFPEAPSKLNLLGPGSPTKRELVARVKQANPGVIAVWLPRALLVPLSWGAMGLQKILRPRKAAVNVAKVFARRRFDTSDIELLTPKIKQFEPAHIRPDLGLRRA